MSVSNIFGNLPETLPEELVETLLSSQNLRIERIISKGHASPPDFWYDQEEHEWVLLVSGAAILCLHDGKRVELKPGDHLLLPAHCKHRVEWTTPDQETIWLAIFYS